MSKARRQHRSRMSPRLRQLLRQERAAVAMDLQLQERDHDVRLTLPKIAWEGYDEVPDCVSVRYLTEEHALVIDLPEPDTSPDRPLSEFES
jgi:hypothetical protein